MPIVSKVYLMYHELQLPGRSLCQNETGYLRYVVRQCDFRAHLCRLKENNVRGLSVAEALLGLDINQPAVAITFDDGCETDLLAAAPLLKEFGFNATFYVVAGWVGRRGYLSVSQLRDLAGLNFEIGCHSMTHAYLTDLHSRDLHREIVQAKEQLEQLVGGPVDEFSCPGGRWSRRVAEMACQAGYRSVATSRIGTNSHSTDRFHLARLAVRGRDSIATFDRIWSGKGILRRRAQESFLSFAKALLGNPTYEKVRSVILG